MGRKSLRPQRRPKSGGAGLLGGPQTKSHLSGELHTWQGSAGTAAPQCLALSWELLQEVGPGPDCGGGSTAGALGLSVNSAACRRGPWGSFPGLLQPSLLFLFPDHGQKRSGPKGKF